MKGLALALVAVTTGCSCNTVWQLNAGSPQPNPTVQVYGSTGAANVLGVAIIAGGIYEVARSGVSFASESRRAPEMAPDRKVSEQDCSKPLDYTLGNIRCK